MTENKIKNKPESILENKATNNTPRNTVKNTTKNKKSTEVYTDLDKNQQWFEQECKNCADIKIRPMNLGSDGKRKCLAVYIETTVDNLVLEESMLGRMFQYIDRISNHEMIDNLLQDEMGISDLWPLTTLEEAMQALLAGNLLFLTDGAQVIWKIGSKGYPARSLGQTDAEKVLRGSNEGFSESVKTNVALIRKRIRSTDLKVEELFIGMRSDTLVTIVYMKELVYPDVVEMVRERLQSFEIDGAMDSGVIEQLIQGDEWTPFPQIQPTQRADLAAMELLNGRVAIITDNSPEVLILPSAFHSFMKSSEDQYQRFEIASFQRMIRYVAMLFAMMLSGVYLAVIGFHTQILPGNLVLSFAQAREGVPFPSILEVLFMELAFELIREAGLRMPGPLSGTIGIVGGLIIGDAAVSANLVSPMTVVVVAVSALSTFAVPNEEFASAFRLIKYAFILAGGLLGMFGIVAVDFLLLCHLAGLSSFGIPYLEPFAAKGIEGYQNDWDGILRAPGKRSFRRALYARRNQRIRLKFKKEGEERNVR